MPFPRAINPGVDSVKVNFDDFTLEVRDVETMGPVEIIHQVANPKAAHHTYREKLKTENSLRQKLIHAYQTMILYLLKIEFSMRKSVELDLIIAQ